MALMPGRFSEHDFEHCWRYRCMTAFVLKMEREHPDCLLQRGEPADQLEDKPGCAVQQCVRMFHTVDRLDAGVELQRRSNPFEHLRRFAVCAVQCGEELLAGPAQKTCTRKLAQRSYTFRANVV